MKKNNKVLVAIAIAFISVSFTASTIAVWLANDYAGASVDISEHYHIHHTHNDALFLKME